MVLDRPQSPGRATAGIMVISPARLDNGPSQTVVESDGRCESIEKAGSVSIKDPAPRPTAGRRTKEVDRVDHLGAAFRSEIRDRQIADLAETVDGTMAISRAGRHALPALFA